MVPLDCSRARAVLSFCYVLVRAGMPALPPASSPLSQQCSSTAVQQPSKTGLQQSSKPAAQQPAANGKRRAQSTEDGENAAQPGGRVVARGAHAALLCGKLGLLGRDVARSICMSLQARQALHVTHVPDARHAQYYAPNKACLTFPADWSRSPPRSSGYKKTLVKG